MRHCGTQGYELGNKTCTKYLIKTEVKITESQRCRDNRKLDTGINLKGVAHRYIGIVSDMSMDWIWTWIRYENGSDGWTELDMDMD